MGLLFRETFPLGKLFRFTLSKSGVSLGIGPRGANVNIGPRGVRSTVGIPGTGISYQETQGWPHAGATSPGNVVEGTRRSAVPWLLLALVLLAVWFVAHNSGAPPLAPAPKSASIVPTPPPPAPPVNIVDRVLTRDEVRELQRLLKQ